MVGRSAKWFGVRAEGKRDTTTYVREQGAWKRAVGKVRGRRSGVVGESRAIGISKKEAARRWNGGGWDERRWRRERRKKGEKRRQGVYPGVYERRVDDGSRA